MLYEKYEGYPEPGSPLETVFMLVWLQKQQANLLATQALVAAVRAGDSDEAGDVVVKAFDDYANKMFPFFERASDTKLEEEKKALMDLVRRPLRIKLADVYKAKQSALKKINQNMKKRASVMERFKAKEHG